MSTKISEQFDRIEGAVSDIKTAIINKGVTVPSAAKINDLAPLVSSIPQFDTSDADAVAGDILLDKTAYVKGEKVTGTMPNNRAVTGWLGNNAVGLFVNRYNIPAGYHDGSGVVWINGETTSVTPKEFPIKVVPKNLNSALQEVTVGAIPSKYKDVTEVDATAADVLSPKKIVDKNGNVLTGAIPSVEGGIVAPSPDSWVTVIDGGTYAKDRIEVAPIPTKYKDTSSGDAVAGEIISGKKAWVDGSEVTGTMTDRGAIDVKINPTVMPSKSYTIPKGYHDGNGKVSWEFTSSPTVYPTKEEQVVHSELGTVGMLSVTVKPIPSTYITTSDATASAGHIVDGETAYVDGKKVTGTLKKYDGSQLEGLAAGAGENNVIVVTHFEDPNYVEGDSYVYSNVPLEGFGNATASDVRVGKTFTSSAGLKEDGTMPNVGVPAPTFTAQLDDDDDSGNTVWLRASVSQSAGYTAGGNKSTDIFPKLTVSGDTATMECGGVSISRKVGASIATCTVEVTFKTTTGSCLISATTFANGAISVYNSSASSGTITIPNVVCGSALSINTTKMVSLYTSANQQPHNSLLGGTVKIPATAGQTYTIEVGMVDD